MNFKKGTKVRFKEKILGFSLKSGDIGIVVNIENQMAWVRWEKTKFRNEFNWWVYWESIERCDAPNHPYTNIFK